MAQPTKPGAFGSHFNYLENHPMWAESALDINTFQFFATFVGNIFRSDEYMLYQTRQQKNACKNKWDCAFSAARKKELHFKMAN